MIIASILVALVSLAMPTGDTNQSMRHRHPNLRASCARFCSSAAAYGRCDITQRAYQPTSWRDTLDAPRVDNVSLDRGISVMGQPYALNHFFSRLEEGKPVTVGVLGASVAANAGCLENRPGHRCFEFSGMYCAIPNRNSSNRNRHATQVKMRKSPSAGLSAS